jgi:hypothetical protein
MCDTCFISNPPDVGQCRTSQSVQPDATCSSSESSLTVVPWKTNKSSDGNKLQSTGGFKISGSLQLKTMASESTSAGKLSEGFKLPSTGSVSGGLFGGFKSHSKPSEGAGGGGFKLPSGTLLGKQHVPAESNLTIAPKAMGLSTSQTVSSEVIGGENKPETVDRAMEDKAIGSAANLTSASELDKRLIAPVMTDGQLASLKGQESEVMQHGSEEPAAGNDKPVEKYAFQLAVPSFGTTARTSLDSHETSWPSATGGQAFQPGNHPVVSTLGESTGSNLTGSKLQFGQSNVNQNNQPSVVSTTTVTDSHQKESSGFNLQFKQPVASSFDQPSLGVDKLADKPFLPVSGRNEGSKFSNTGGFQISNFQNNKLFGSVRSELSHDKPPGLLQGGSRPLIEPKLFQSGETKSQDGQMSSHKKPTFHFGAGIQNQQPSTLGNVKEGTLQAPAFQGAEAMSDKPSFSFNIEQANIRKDPMFPGLGSSGSSSLSVGPSQKSLLGQPSLSSAAVQLFQFGVNPNPNQPPVRFQFGNQGQMPGLDSSSGLLSNNPFNFSNPGVDSAAGDSTVGMEDDAPLGLSQQHTTGGYDFSNSLQPPPFTFSVGQPQLTNPFTNQTHTFTGTAGSSSITGRRMKQAVRRMGKKK